MPINLNDVVSGMVDQVNTIEDSLFFYQLFKQWEIMLDERLEFLEEKKLFDESMKGVK